MKKIKSEVVTILKEMKQSISNGIEKYTITEWVVTYWVYLKEQEGVVLCAKNRHGPGMLI